MTAIFSLAGIARNESRETLSKNGFSFRAAKASWAIALGLISCLGLPLAASAQSDTLTEEQLFQLCSRYPYNTQCEGYEMPIPLEKRQGIEGRCRLETEHITVTDSCKVETNEENISIYIEMGEGISLLDGERTTIEINVSTNEISRLSYSEGTRVSRTLEIANALSLFGQVLQAAGGGSVTPSAPVSTSVPAAKVGVQFDPENPGATSYTRLTFEGDLRQGADFRDEIRSVTGLPAYSFLAEEEASQEEVSQEEADSETVESFR